MDTTQNILIAILLLTNACLVASMYLQRKINTAQLLANKLELVWLKAMAGEINNLMGLNKKGKES